MVDLPLPDCADQRHPLARRHVEREVLDQRRSQRVVAEADVVQRQVAGGLLVRRRARLLGEAPVAPVVQDIVETRQVGRCLLGQAGGADQLLDRAGEIQQQDLEGDQRADRQVAVDDLDGADAQHGGRGQAEHDGRHQVGGLLQDRELLLGVRRARVIARPAGEEVILGAGGLQRLDRLQADHRGREQPAALGREAQRGVRHAAMGEAEHEDVDGRAADGDRRQDGVVEHHDDAEEQRRDAACGDAADVARHQGRDAVVGFDAAHQVARDSAG